MEILRVVCIAAVIVAVFYVVALETQLPVSNDALFVGLCILGAGALASGGSGGGKGN